MEPRPIVTGSTFDLPPQEPQPEGRADRYARELTSALRGGATLDPARLAELVEALSVSLAASERDAKAFQRQVELTLTRFMNTDEGDIFLEELPPERDEEAAGIVIRFLEERLDTLSLRKLARALRYSSGLRRSHHMGGHQLFDPNPQVAQLRIRILAKLFHHEPDADDEVNDFSELTGRVLRLDQQKQRDLRYSPDALKRLIAIELGSV